jgi:hypothetical protein
MHQNLLTHYEHIYPVVSYVIYAGRGIAGRQTVRLPEHTGSIPELIQV